MIRGSCGIFTIKTSRKIYLDQEETWSRNRLMEDPSVDRQMGKKGEGLTAGERDRKRKIEEDEEWNCDSPQVNVSCLSVVGLSQ